MSGGCAPRGREDVHETVRAKYRIWATTPAGHFPYATGAEGARALGYDADLLAAVPEPVLRRFAGVGNPFSVERPAHVGTRPDLAGDGSREGDVADSSVRAGPEGGDGPRGRGGHGGREAIFRGARVLDVGCGSGTDSFVAARLVGPQGAVIGLDLTEEMLDAPREALDAAPVPWLSFVEGAADEMPFPDASFDLVVSNGVLNLVPDKDAAFRELRRVLRPKGMLAAADLVLLDHLPAEFLTLKDGWSS